MFSLIEKKLVPFSKKIEKNAWIQGVQGTFMLIMPLLLTGSVGALFGMMHMVIPAVPDLSILNTFTMGLFGLLASAVMVYKVMEKKGYNSKKLMAGVLALAVYIVLVNPEMTAEGALFDYSRFGASGLINSILIMVWIVNIYSVIIKTGITENKTSLPDFLYDWGINLLVGFIAIVPAILITNVFHIDFFEMMSEVFAPLYALGSGPFGGIVLSFSYVLLYAFGISPWCIAPIMYSIWYNAYDMNLMAVAAGQVPTALYTLEMFCFNAIGGTGCTLALPILASTIAKSKKLKAIGRVTLIPSLFNINEPVIYGFPVAMNVILMIPMFIAQFLVDCTYFLLVGLRIFANPVSQNAVLSRVLPACIGAFTLNGNFMDVVLWLILFAITVAVWYPFFKMYDRQCLEEENNE
ncbi:PTS transporter subunit EIIC [Holdemania massiliensis]|uniref:PTS transporter subunit EIIC n=1 Tax=Holdemania massiliensis TaxID=1468449 RepID=UPI001F05A242|nr:PTS transporter subunit EIIC [Holdemania massiliensis]MCH1939831.1 PTS transporter subunit EIIC [Holdemania massiliensis]